jgi:hypothetical protein
MPTSLQFLGERTSSGSTTEAASEPFIDDPGWSDPADE